MSKRKNMYVKIKLKQLNRKMTALIRKLKIASEMPVPHSLGKYFQHHEIQKHCASKVQDTFRALSVI